MSCAHWHVVRHLYSYNIVLETTGRKTLRVHFQNSLNILQTYQKLFSTPFEYFPEQSLQREFKISRIILFSVQANPEYIYILAQRYDK